MDAQKASFHTVVTKEVEQKNGRLVFWLMIHQGVLFVMLDLETASTKKGRGFVSCFVCMEVGGE